MSQKTELLSYLREVPGRRITAMTALYKLGISRLAPRIKELEAGNNIKRRMIPVINRSGNATRVMEYWL